MIESFVNDFRRIAFTNSDNDYEIQCPYCGCPNTHFKNYKWVEGYESNFDNDKDASNFSSFRQGHLELRVHCEREPDKHEWKYVFGEHKGSTFFEEIKIK